MTLAGIGFALAIPAVTKAVVSLVPAADIGIASGTYFSTMRQLGGAFGVAILAAVFAAAGSYASAAAFSRGFGPAIGVAAALALAGAVAGIALPARRPARRLRPGPPAPASAGPASASPAPASAGPAPAGGWNRGREGVSLRAWSRRGMRNCGRAATGSPRSASWCWRR